MFNEMDLIVDKFFESIPHREYIDEDDLIYEWEEIKDKYPNVSKEEFELAQKEFQEM